MSLSHTHDHLKHTRTHSKYTRTSMRMKYISSGICKFPNKHRIPIPLTHFEIRNLSSRKIDWAHFWSDWASAEWNYFIRFRFGIIVHFAFHVFCSHCNVKFCLWFGDAICLQHISQWTQRIRQANKMWKTAMNIKDTKNYDFPSKRFDEMTKGGKKNEPQTNAKSRIRAKNARRQQDTVECMAHDVQRTQQRTFQSGPRRIRQLAK